MSTGSPHTSAGVGGEHWRHHTLLSFFTFMWGANFILAEVALREMAPISFSVSRFVMGGVAMIVLFYWQSYLTQDHDLSSVQVFPGVDRKDWPMLLLVSVLGATLAPWLGIEGLGLTHGARASLWLALGPVMSTAIGYWFDTERLGWYGHIGVWLAGIGTVVLAMDGIRHGSGYWLGDMLLFFALLMVVAELHLVKPLAHKYGSVSIVAARTAIGGFLYMLIAAPSLVDEPWLSLGFWTWVAILAGGCIGVGVGQWAKVRALNTIGPTRVVLYGNLVPLAAIAIAWLALDTIPSVYESIASVLIIGGAICTQVIDTESTHRLPADDKLEGT